MVHFRVTLDLEMNNETGVRLIKAEAYEMEKQCEMRQKYSKCIQTISNTCIKLHSSSETEIALINNQLSIPTNEIYKNCVILFIFSKAQKENSDFKVSKCITFSVFCFFYV